VNDATPPLSVVLITRDRRDLALGALDAVAMQLEPGDELVAVDDGSSDGTEAALRDWLGRRRPNGRLIRLAGEGVSAARNAGLAAGSADVVCFVDDDERVAPGWLATLRRAWREAQPDVGAVGGPKRIVWQAPRPPWLADYLLYVVNGPDLGPERRVLDQTPGTGFLSGGNLSLRRSAAAALGGFDTTLGMRPSAPYDRGEEEDLQRRLAAAGWRIVYEPTTVVDHLVAESRLTPAYFHETFRDRALRHAARGDPRSKALAVLGRSAARFVFLSARGRPEATNSRFEWTYGWTLLTAPRRAASRSAGSAGVGGPAAASSGRARAPRA
jgi:glucosyl-dolichyl phosphate glucuronosyltransferase